MTSAAILAILRLLCWLEIRSSASASCGVDWWAFIKMPIAIAICRFEANATFKFSLRSRARALARANAPCVASRRPKVWLHRSKACGLVE